MPKDQVANPHELQLQLSVNDEVRQNGPTVSVPFDDSMAPLKWIRVVAERYAVRRKLHIDSSYQSDVTSGKKTIYRSHD